LQNELIENEYKWSLFEDEKTEFLMEISDLIFENLVEEFSIDILLKEKQN